MFCLAVLASLLSLVQVASEKDYALLRVASDAFAANQAAFAHGAVTFSLEQGSAASVDVARHGDFDRKIAARGSYVFNEEAARLERRYDREDLKKASIKIGNDHASPYQTCLVATNGRITLFVTETGYSDTRRIAPGAEIFDREFQFPLALGRRTDTGVENTGRNFREALQAGSDFKLTKVEQNVEFEGRRVLKVTLSYPNGEGQYWIDLERGGIPLQATDRTLPLPNFAGGVTTYRFEHIRLVPAHGWLPHQESWHSSSDNSGGRIVITHADFDRVPARSAFAIEFPKEVTMYDEAKGLRYPASRSWNVADMPSDRGPGVVKESIAPPPGPDAAEMPGERPPGWRFGPLAYGLAAIGAAVTLILWRRNRDV